MRLAVSHHHSILSLKALESEICQKAANLTAAECEWLLMVAEFDRRDGWHESGCTSAAAWLAWQLSMEKRIAYDKLRVGHALHRYPQFADAMAAGVLSYAKVRALAARRADAAVAMAEHAIATSDQPANPDDRYLRHPLSQPRLTRARR